MNIHYLAALFDGEGSVSLKKQGDLDINIASCHRPTLELIREEFEFGCIHKVGRNTVKICYQWSTGSNCAARVLYLLEPYLIQKREQALVAIEYHTLRNTSRRAGSRDYALIERYRSRLTELKAKSY